MLGNFDKKHETPLDGLITETLTQLDTLGPGDDEYAVLLDKLERLYKLRKEDRPNRVDRNTIALIAGNIAGILLIVAYEQKHVMNSRAMPQLLKPKTPKIDT